MDKVAVVAAHPDDELLGVGGTLAKHLQDGDEVHAIILSEGASSRYDDGTSRTLAKSIENAATEMGFTSLQTFSLPDQRLDAMPLIEVTQTVEEALADILPTVVYTHWPHDVNSDHGITARATWTACRPYSQPQIRLFAAFETPSSTEWAWPLSETGFKPQLFVDISETLDQKLAAMQCYETELRAYPHPRSIQALGERARHWGSHVGVGAAEAFVVLREIL